MDCEFTGEYQKCDGDCIMCYYYREWLKWN